MILLSPFGPKTTNWLSCTIGAWPFMMSQKSVLRPLPQGISLGLQPLITPRYSSSYVRWWADSQSLSTSTTCTVHMPRPISSAIPRHRNHALTQSKLHHSAPNIPTFMLSFVLQKRHQPKFQICSTSDANSLVPSLVPFPVSSRLSLAPPH